MAHSWCVARLRYVSDVVHAPVLCNRAREPLQWAALETLYVSLGVRVATITTRTTRSCAPSLGALPASVPASVSLSLSSHATLPVLASVPLLLSTFAPRLCSAHLRLRSSLSYLSALLCSELCSSSFVSAFPSSRTTPTKLQIILVRVFDKTLMRGWLLSPPPPKNNLGHGPFINIYWFETF